MQRARQNIPSFMGAYIPPCGDVAGGVEIRIGDKVTVCASERFAVPYSDMQTFGASLRGVGRRNSDNFDAREFSLVFKKTAELCERPRIYPPSERLVAFLLVGSLADIGQVLDRYALIPAFSLLYNLFADSMVDNGCESPLTSVEPFQQSMCAACAFGLNGSPCLVILLPNAVDFCRRIGFTLGCDGNVGHAHVNTYKLGAILNIFIGNVYCLIEKELAFDKKEVSLTFGILHKFRTVADVRYFNTSTDNRERSLLLCSVAENTAIICNCPKLAEFALFLFVKFVGISNLTDCSDHKLSGKSVSILDDVVDLLVQIKLTKAALLPRYCGNGIASLIEHTDCLFQTLGLLSIGHKFNLQSQFHAVKLIKIFEFIKYLKEMFIQRRNVVQFLPRLNSWVSLN